MLLSKERHFAKLGDEMDKKVYSNNCEGCANAHLQIEILRLKRRIEELEANLSMSRETDMMTGLANKKRLIREIEYHIALSKRIDNMNFSIAFIDIDGFKKWNDTNHLLGDKLIIEFADFLSISVRACDIVARFGGDEFCIIIPNSTKDEAEIVCKKLEKSLARYDFNREVSPIRLDASWGVSSTSELIDTSEKLLEIADSRQIAQKKAKTKKV